MSKRNSKLLLIFDNLKIIIFLINFLSLNIVCENECNCDVIIENNFDTINTIYNTGDCDKNCRFSLTKNKWYYCDKISSSSFKYYLIRAEDDKCIPAENCIFGNTPYKVVPKTKECIQSCSYISNENSIKKYFYEFGDFCLFDNQNKYKDEYYDEGKKKYYIVPTIYGHNLLQCNLCINIIEIDKMKFYECIKCQECPYHYDYENRICIETCGNKKIVINSKECRNECENFDSTTTTTSSYEYSESNDDNTETKIYCLKNCPDNAKFYYKIDDIKPRKCIKECNDKDFYNNENECIKTCDNKYIKEYSKNFFKCINDENCKNTDYPYTYGKTCLKSCKDTQLEIFNKIITYENDDKECVLICPQNFYKDNDSYSCVNNCKETKNKFSFNSECLPSCPENYYYTSDKYECVTKCPKDYFLLRENGICYKKCPEESGKIFVDENGECTACDNKETQFYKYEDENDSGIKRCYTSCPEGHLFRFFDSNICYNSEGNTKCKDIGTKIYPYYSIEKPYICYPSCQSISNSYKYEIEDYICSKESNCQSYYYIHNEIKKCLEESTYISKCSKMNFKYLKGNECIEKCEDEEYKISPDQTIYQGVISLGKCCSDPENCDSSYKFYTISNKFISTECPYKRIKDINSDPPIKSSDGNCVMKCPTDFPYENIEGTICSDSCQENQYYYKGGENTFKCVNNCKDVNKYHFEHNKECIELNECKNKDFYLYYDSDTNICYSSCKVVENKEFSFNASELNFPQRCISECPQGYYYKEEDKICLNKCDIEKGLFYKNETSKICVDKCQEKEKVINNNYCSNECKEYEPFFITKPLSDAFYIIINKCVSSCELEDKNYIYYDNNTFECLTNCPLNGTKYKYGKICIDECPEGSYIDSNECKVKCDTKYFRKKYIDAQNISFNYECVNSCGDNYISSTGECVEDCTIGESFIGKNRHCKGYCDPEDDGKYFKFFKNSKFNDIPYNIYQCFKQIPYAQDEKNYLIYGTNMIVDNCSENNLYLSENENICYKICKDSAYYPFSVSNTEEGNQENKICSTKCEGESKYFGDDKVCMPNCNHLFETNIINDEDNLCVSHCNLNSSYRFKTHIETDGIKLTHCSEKCDDSEPKYSTSDYNCTSKCLPPYNYVWNNECLLICPENTLGSEGEENEFICNETCTDESKPYFYKSDRKCISFCNEGDYIIENTTECVSLCNSIGTIKYYYYEPTQNSDSNTFQNNTCVVKCPSDKPYLRQDNHCDKKCDINSYNYYNEEDKICNKSCPKDYKIIDNNDGTFECVKNCNSSYFEDANHYCISNCTKSLFVYKYYIPHERKCLPKCNETMYYTEDYKCLSSCSEEKYSNNKICIDICPNYKKFFVGQFTHGENNTVKECLYSCPKDYPFLNISINEENVSLYECVGNCEYYINETEPKECKDECNGENKYYVIDEKGSHSCLKICPNEAPYYIQNEDDKNIKCYEKCPEETYKEINSNECVKSCSSKIIDYEKNECVYGCSINQFWSKNQETGMTYCLKKCISLFGEYHSNDNECVFKCKSEDPPNFLENDITNPIYKRCKCENLFIINNEGKTICLNPIYEECKSIEGYLDYKYRIFGSNQCTNFCFGLLSPEEEICYLSYTNCSHIPNTDIVLVDNKMKCDCIDKFYITQDKKKICLAKNEECNVENYLKLNVLNRECLKDCQNLYEYDNKCFKNCPESTSVKPNSNLCVYMHKWYKKGENEYYFLGEGQPCPADFPFLISETRECVDNCTGLKYSYMYKDICYKSCDEVEDKKIDQSSLIKVKPKKGSKYFNKTLYECQCNNIWNYEENGDIVCHPSSKTQCDEGYYLIKDTNECVKSCPIFYSYYFNKECFESCENAKNIYHYSVKKKEGSNECICENLWRNVSGNIVVCLNDIVCGENELLINETKECIMSEKCPLNSPFKFNGICYKEGECPENTKENLLNGEECSCIGLWFKQKNGYKFCFKDSTIECPYETHPYLIYSTKECVTDKCSGSNPKIFNYTCYEKCPDGSIEDKDNRCICDSQFGFWYIKGDSWPIMICEQSECPINMGYYRNDTKECLSSCAENGFYKYNNICYIEGCPNPTVSENERTNKYECVSRKYATATNLTELSQFLREELVDLYKSIPKGGITYKNFSSTMQIYGVNKNDSNSKDIILRSRLSYIDISGCSKKIFENNNMKDTDDIIIVKYDLENQPTKSLINPVEYEFISSRTGQVLDMSVCTKDDVIISYSLSDILNYNKNYNERRLQENKDNSDYDKILTEIQKQYNKGKEITYKYNMDSFNINSSIYSDICFSIEIDGKDLVLEDRVKYLYPYYSLCEENCSYSHTDFELERIYCNCHLKLEFDLEREHKFAINFYSIDEILDRQNGPTNIPVMKCMSRLSEKKSFSQNGGFFFSLIVFLLELILLFVTIFYSYNILKNKIYKKFINNDEKEIELNNEVVEVGHKKNIKNKKLNEINVKTSERGLDSPPPKKREINLNEKIPNDFKLETKIIKEKVDYDGTEVEDQKNNNLEDNSDNSFFKWSQIGIFNSIKKEKKLLRAKYEKAIIKDKSDIFIMLLTEICDKIYLLKTIFLLSKYDMFPIYISAYLLYHLLLLTFITCFYDIKTIKKIWNKENYPSLGYHLGFGLLSCLIVWVIYKIFLCILDNQDSIKKFLREKDNNGNDPENNNNIIKKNNKKFKNLLYKIKTGMIVYFIIEFIIIIICLLYLTVFCAVYTGTKKRIFKTYGIALIEVLIIKIIYGIILGILRKVGLEKQKKGVYKIAYYFDKLVY